MNSVTRVIRKSGIMAACCTGVGLILGAFGAHGLAQVAPPTEHKGISIDKLGVISEKSMKASVGLEGHILQLRVVTIDSGGQIAKHSHKTSPGLVKMISGVWVEGRESGETTFDAETPTALIEDEETVHWVYNRSAEPATAIVCSVNQAK